MNVDGSDPRTLPGSGTANLDPTFPPGDEAECDAPEKPEL